MKKILALGFSLVLSNAAFAKVTTFVCTPDNVRLKPYDTFLITVGKGKAYLEYERRAVKASTELVSTLDVPGCDPAQDFYVNSKEVYVECAAGGDMGFLKLRFLKKHNKRGFNISGMINFPESVIGYFEDTSIKVSCAQF